MSNRRNRNAEQAEGTEAAEATNKRAPLVVGEVSVEVDEDQTTSGKGTRMDTDPVALAVKNAEKGVWNRVRVEDAEKVTGVKSLLRRAGTYYGVGINIDPRDNLADDRGSYVRFKTDERRQVTRKAKDANADGTPEGSVLGDVVDNAEGSEYAGQ